MPTGRRSRGIIRSRCGTSAASSRRGWGPGNRWLGWWWIRRHSTRISTARTTAGQSDGAERLVYAAPARELPDQVADHRFRVAKQHPRVVLHIQLVVDAGEAGILAALDGEHGLGLVRVGDRHAVA